MNKPSSLPLLTGHRIFLFYTFKRGLDESWDAPPTTNTLGSLLKKQEKSVSNNNWIYPHAKEFFVNRYNESLIWEPSSLKLGSDLHPHIQNALGKSGEQQPDAKTYKLSQHARNFAIEGKIVHNPDQLSSEQKQQKRIKFNFGELALSRIEQQLGMASGVTLYLKLESIQAICFRTGWIIFILEAKLELSNHASIHPVWLQESLATLTKVNRMSWEDPSQTEKHRKENHFHLGEMISGMAGMPMQSVNQRIFSATYLQFDQAPEEEQLVQLQTRLSRHYTDAYEIIKTPKDLMVVCEFSNIRHSFSIEGCCSCCITENASSKSFLQDYFSATYNQHYIPIILLAIHEYSHLVKLTNDSSFWPVLNHRNCNDLIKLTQLRDDILHFRLCFRYSAVSQITMHNQTNIALRKTLGLNTMLTELDNDTKEINAFLDQKNAENLSERFRLVSIFGVFIITWSASYQTLETFLPKLFEYNGISLDVWVSNTVVSLIFSFVAAITIALKKPSNG